MSLPLNYSARNLWVRKGTTLATTAAVALVVFVCCASLMLERGVRGTLLGSGSRDAAIVMQQSATAEVASSLPQAVFGLVASAPGIERGPGGTALVTREVVRSLQYQSLDGSRVASLQVRGVSENVLSLRPDVRIVAGRRATPGTDEAMLGTRVAGRYRGLQLGGEVDMNKGRRLKVVGVFEAGGAAFESEIWADLHSVQTTTESDGYISSVTARLEPDAFETFASAIQDRHREEGLIVERESQYYERLSRGLSGMILVLGGFISGVFSLAAMLGAAIAMYAAVERRTKEIGVLRSLGFGRRDILLAFIVESTGVSLIGTAFGLIFALSTTALEFAVGNSAAFGTEVSLRFVPSLSSLGPCALVGLSLGVVGGLFPALQASRIDPIRALRG
jgi:putative ABC transport system permease protein